MQDQPPGLDKSPGAAWLDSVKFDANGLVPAVAQDAASGQVLMMAWMNAEALERTVADGVATYFSRSRQRLWVKGESSGHRQDVVELRLDCDGDCVLMRVHQHGGIACHTGRRHCFYRRHNGDGWAETDGVLKDPTTIYGDGVST